ncbi:MAG: FadR family transcriptional regulator [Burkholderiales bacterium]|nr:FadR family transcriptional regulator [Burkholderiales bacterium]
MSISLNPGHSGLASGGPDHLVTERLSDRLATLLGAQVQSGRLKPGDRLPSEAQLAETHGVSRTVVREAVHQLKSRGLLRSRQGSGVFVAPPPLNQSLAFDPSVLESVDAVVHVVEVRRVIEAEIAALAAERASNTQIAAMRKALAGIDSAAAAGQDGVAEDLAFHRAIALATGNPQLVLLMGFFEQYLREAMRITRGNEARRQDFMDAVRLEHRAIVDAIAAHDSELARQRATEHLVHGEQRLIEGGVISKGRKPAPRRAKAAPVVKALGETVGKVSPAVSRRVASKSADKSTGKASNAAARQKARP